MANMLTSPDMHLLLLALSAIWHLIQVGNNHHHQHYSFLLESVLHDAFYDTLEAVAVQAQDEQMRITAAAIVEFAIRVREEE